MRIQFVITDLEVGGVPLHLLRLAAALHAAGHHVGVISLAEPGAVAEALRTAGIAVKSCAAAGSFDLRVLWRLRRLVRAFAPDIVHSLLFHANLACRLSGLVPPERLLCEIQTVEIERNWHLTLDRWTMRRARLTIGNSKAVVDHLYHAADIPRDRLRVIHGGIDAARYADVAAVPRNVLNIPADAPLIGWVGRLDPVKDLPTLLEAASVVPRAHIALVGQGPERDNLRMLARNLDCTERVHFLGLRNDVPALLHSFDIFAFPSLTEGLPNALMEAMAAACPIICSDIGGNRELIDPGVHGLCVPPGNVPALVDGLQILLTDRDQAIRMGQQARARIVTDFTLDAMVRKYSALYEECLVKS